MTITIMPMDATAGAPAYTAMAYRQANAANEMAGTDTFGSRSGWRVGTPTNILTATSTAWTLQPCSAVLSPNAVQFQGAYGWGTNTSVTGTVTAADATNPRLDIVYIQVNDSSAGDGSGALTAPVNYLAGTPNVAPVAPALPSRSFLVGTISVPKVGGGSPSVIFNNVVNVAAGAAVPVNSQAERDALTAYETLEVIRKDKGNTREMYTSGVWVNAGGQQIAYTPVLTSTGTNPSLGTGVATGQYQVTGKSMTVQFFVPFSTTGSVGTGNYLVSLPPGFTYGGIGSVVPLGTFQAHLNSTPADISGHCRQNTSGGNNLLMYWQSAATTTAIVGSGTVAWAAQAGTYMAGQITVPIA